VRLDADAVELPFHGGFRADPGEGIGDRRLAGGQHRLQRLADPQAERGQFGAAAAQRRPRGPRQ
jgi:hypothetical protein